MFHADGPPCIVGRYRLLGKVMGKGNYARVEEAVHLDLQEAHIAIKMIDTHTVQDRYVLQHLHREARVLRHLQHPNIIAIFEVLRAGSYYCLVTELAGGGELCAHVRPVSRQPRGHLDETSTLQFGAQLISAVAHMHSLNVVHRDLKTKNIMLTRRGDQVKIIDFGLGRTWSPADPLRTHCGSPGYAAPEIYQRDRSYGSEVDLWSLGVVLYFMAVGRMPFPPCRQGDKDGCRTEEERRRRLVALINKGATEHHVKLMGHFSPDFRDLVQGLLTPRVSRRLTLQQTLQHPWVSNRLRARQMLNIQYKLSSAERAMVLTKLSIMRKIPVQSIVAQCRQDPLGEIAAMFNILAHKQLSRYHATWVTSWLTRPATRSHSLSARAMVGGHETPRHRGSHRCEYQPVGRVDQPDSSADEASALTPTSMVTSLSTERPHSAVEQLPAPAQPLALVHQVDDGGEEGQSARQVQTVMEAVKRMPSDEEAAKRMSSDEGVAKEIPPDEDPKDPKRLEYDIACLLMGSDGREKLEPLPETTVMYYTDVILDNVHGAVKSTAACPTKSSLASQTGLAAKTRKAVSFSIIDGLADDLGDVGHRKETGVQVNLVSLSPLAVLAEDVNHASKAEYVFKSSTTTGAGVDEQVEVQVSDALPLSGRGSPYLATRPTPSEGSQQYCGMSKLDVAATERLLKTVPLSRKVSPEPKKSIYETRRWPLRSPRTVYKRMKDHSRLSLAYLLDDQETLGTDGAAISTVMSAIQIPSNVLPSHKEESTGDESTPIEHFPRLKGDQVENNDIVHMSRSLKNRQADLCLGSEGSNNAVIEKNRLSKRILSSTESSSQKSFNIQVLPNEKSKGHQSTLTDMEKIDNVKENPKSTNIISKPTVTAKQKSQKRETRGKSPRFQRFLPNRYRVDLALVMTLERSRKNTIPSVQGPWTSTKTDKLLKSHDRPL